MRKEIALGAVISTLAAPTLWAQSAPPLVTGLNPDNTLITSGGTLGPNSSTAFTVETVGTGGNYGGYGPYQTGVGGEFSLYAPSLAAAIANYAPGAKNQVPGVENQPSFQTFCVEGDEYIYPSPTVSDVTRSGFSIYTDVTLSKGAAYLYSQFATGGDFGGNATYDYANTITAADPNGRSTSAGELQNALWALMGAQEGQTPDNNVGNPFLMAAEAEFGGTFAGASAAGGADYDGVYVLNLWAPGEVGAPAGAQQDQLIYWPTPDAGSTLALLGCGLGGLAFLRRRR